jgi:hypothetical protein
MVLAVAVFAVGCGGKDQAPEPRAARDAGTVEAPKPWPRPYGPVVTAYDRLLAAGCDLEKANINTALEARILRYTPHAMAGGAIHDRPLASFFTSESWYISGELGRGGYWGPRNVVLAGADARCVARLEQRERELRRGGAPPEELEAVLLSDPSVYFGLRKLATVGFARGRRPTRLRHHSATRRGKRTWVWKLRVIGEPGEEYVTVRCHLDDGEWDCRLRAGTS